MQHALVYKEYNGPLRVKELPIPEPKGDEILIKINYSGVCHSDLHGWQGDWAEHCTLPTVGGHEGAGEVVKVGSHVKDWKVGEKAGVRLMNNHCFSCEYCKSGREASCRSVSQHGFIEDGTFQEYVVIRGVDAIRIPDQVDLAEASSVLCAGVTVYTALKESNVKPGQIVVLTGAGGGLGSFGIQYAKAMGMRVLAIDHPSKEEHCKLLGAEWFVDGYNTLDIVKTVQELTTGGAHGVVNLAVNIKAMETSILYTRPRGTIVFVAFPKESKVRQRFFSVATHLWLYLDTLIVIVNALTIKGSLFGSRLDTEEALDFLTRGIVKIPYKLVRLDQVKEVFEQLEKGTVISRCVIDMSLL